MEVRDARHEMTQRFDATKSQAALLVQSDQAPTRTSHTISWHRTVSGAMSFTTGDATLSLSVCPASRSAQLLQDVLNTSEPTWTHTDQTVEVVPHPVTLLFLELRRADAFTSLFRTTLPHLIGVYHCEGLLTSMEQHELPARWVLQGLNDLPSTVPPTRDRVSLLDVGATARLVRSVSDKPAALFTVIRTSAMARGQYWVDLAPIKAAGSTCPVTVAADDDGDDADTVEGQSGGVRRVDCDDVRLYPAKPLHVDALIPCDEACSSRGTSTCLFLSLLLGSQRRREANTFANACCKRPRDESSLADDVDGLAAVAVAAEPDIAGLTVAMSRAVAAARAVVWSARHELPRAMAPHAVPSVRPGNVPARSSPDVTCCWSLEVWLEAADAVKLVLTPPLLKEAAEVVSDGRQRTGTFEAIRSVSLLVRTLQKLARDYDLQGEACDCASSSSHQGTSVNAWCETAIKATAALFSQHGADVVPTSVLLWSSAVAVVTESGGLAPALTPLPSATLAQQPSSSCSSPSLSSHASQSEATRLCCFFVRVFTMCYRYRTLQGDEGYNGGPHAAIPPAVLESLRTSLSVTMEAFASPLNHYFPLFGSLFPDTDACFGSVGSFFDLMVSRGHVEVNPPFDTAVLERTRRTIIESLERSENGSAPPATAQSSALKDTPATSDCTSSGPEPDSLLFVVVLPSHDLSPSEQAQQRGHTDDVRRGLQRGMTRGATAANSASRTGTDAPRPPSADRALRESRFCLAHVLCHADESAYVDGQQHLLRAPLFCIRSPTRLIVLGNSAARRRYPDITARLEQVRRDWASMTRSALPRSSLSTT